MKLTVKAWLCASQPASGGKPYFNVFNFDPTTVKGGGEFIVIRAVEYVEEVDEDMDIREPMVKALEEQKRQLRADFAKSITDIERRISELQAIGCEVQS